MSNIFVSKTDRAFYQTVFTAVVALAMLIFASFKAYQLSILYLEVLIHKIKDACGCESMTQFFSMHPDIFRAVILFGIGIGVFILYSIYKFAKLIVRTEKYTRHYLSFAKAGHSAKLKAAIKTLDLDRTRIIEIDKPDLSVFCFGFLAPKICISRTLVGLLDKNELRAVLAHEAQHMASYEPLKIFIVKYFRSIFFFLPGIKIFAKKYMTFSELSADEKASESAMARSKLASAILKISGQEEYRWRSNNPSLSYFSSVIFERANRLSDETYVPEFKFWDKSLIAGSLGLAVVSLAFIFIFSNSTKAFEMHHIAGCVTPASPQSDLACVIGEDHRVIFNLNNNNFSSLNNAGSNQDYTCQGH